MEDWQEWRPRAGDQSGHQGKGTINVDGANYDGNQANERPAIHKGDATDFQVFSIRRHRSSGSISISEHFKSGRAWGLS